MMWLNTAGHGKKFPRTPTIGTVRHTQSARQYRARDLTCGTAPRAAGRHLSGAVGERQASGSCREKRAK
jgi:hypothetical protein